MSESREHDLAETIIKKEDDVANVNCGYCLVDYAETIDPRKLPCGHTACLSCLQQTYYHTNFLCPHCRKDCGQVKFEELPKVEGNPTTSVPGKEKKKKAIPCDRCKDKESEAVGYCADCGLASCEKHRKFHDGYYDETHKMVDISVYQQKPNDYLETVHCDRHPEESVKMACQKCYCFSCVKCASGNQLGECNSYIITASETHIKIDRLGPNYGGRDNDNDISALMVAEHRFIPLRELDQQLREENSIEIAVINSSISSTCKSEKSLSDNLDAILENCPQMKENIDSKMKEQIEYIKSQCLNLHRRVDEYLERSMSSYNTKMAASIAKRAEMEAVRGGAEAFLKQADIKMLMKDTASWSKKMADVQKDSSVEPLDVQILRIGKKRRLEIDIDDSEEDNGPKQASRNYCGRSSHTSGFFINEVCNWEGK